MYYSLGMVPNARERLVVEMLTRLHRYVRDSGAAAPAAFFEAYDPLSTGAISIPAFRSALSGFHVPHFCLSTSDMELLASHYSFGGDPSMISYLSLLDDMSKTPYHLETSWRKASTHASSSLIRLEKLERLRSELCMLQQKKLAIIAGLALQAGLCQGWALALANSGVSTLVSALRQAEGFGHYQTLYPTFLSSTLRRCILALSRPSRASRPTTRPSVSHRARSASLRWRARGATRCARATRRRSRWRRARRAWWGRTRGRAPCTTCTACTASVAYSICHLHHSALCAVPVE